MNVLTGTTSAGMGSTVIMLVLMIAIFYFMLIRPENKRKKEAEQMRGAVKKGDKIVTIGGIAGVVVDVKESRIVVETSADQVRIELEKWAISSNETATEAAKAEVIARERNAYEIHEMQSWQRHMHRIEIIWHMELLSGQSQSMW